MVRDCGLLEATYSQYIKTDKLFPSHPINLYGLLGFVFVGKEMEDLYEVIGFGVFLRRLFSILSE